MAHRVFPIGFEILGDEGFILLILLPWDLNSAILRGSTYIVTMFAGDSYKNDPKIVLI